MSEVKVTLFTDDWYHEMIVQQLNGYPNASADAQAIANAIMCAGAFIAQALDHALSDRDGDTASLGIGRIADQLHRAVDVYERATEGDS